MNTLKEQTQKPTFSKDRIALMFYILDTNQRNNADIKTNAERAFQYKPYYKILQDMYNGKPTNLSDDEVKFLNIVNKTVDEMIKNGRLYKSNLGTAKKLIATTKITQIRENKILKEYILKNTGEKFEETPFGQLVADEVNKAVAEIPEIKLALEYLSEQEDPELAQDTADLGRKYATYALNRVRDELASQLEKIVTDVLKEIERAP